MVHYQGNIRKACTAVCWNRKKNRAAYWNRKPSSENIPNTSSRDTWICDLQSNGWDDEINYWLKRSFFFGPMQRAKIKSILQSAAKWIIASCQAEICVMHESFERLQIRFWHRLKQKPNPSPLSKTDFLWPIGQHGHLLITSKVLVSAVKQMSINRRRGSRIGIC